MIASIEPVDSVNTELSWKAVTKGFRSATRRRRKINQSLNIGLKHNARGTSEEPSVADSEESGVAVLRHHYSEKIDHLPIKKRRRMQQSLAEPPCIPFDQLNGVLGQEIGASGGLVISRRDEKPIVNKKPVCSIDSYGIELLADTACNTSIDDDDRKVNAVKVEENDETLPLSGASTHAALLEENIACPQGENSLLKDFKVEDHAEPRQLNNSPVVSDDIHDNCDGEAGKSSSSGKDVRLHWDLNTVMDEWEQPPENMSAKCSSEIDVPTQVTIKSEFPGSGLFAGSDPMPSNSPLLEMLDASTTQMTVRAEDHCLSSDLQLGQTLAVENVQLGKQDLGKVDLTISEKRVCDEVKLEFDKDRMSDGRNTKSLSGTTLGSQDHSRNLGIAAPSFEIGRELLEKQDINVPSIIVAPLDSSSEAEVKKLEQKSCDHFHEEALDDLLDDGDVSDYSPSGYHHLVIIEKMSKSYHSGYESPVEDGELRETFDRSWQENKGDCLDLGIGNLCVSEAGSGSNCNLPENVTSGKVDSSKESSHSVTTGNSDGRNQIYRGCEHDTKTVKQKIFNLGEVGAFDSTQVFGLKGSLEEKIGSRATRPNLSTHLQGLSGSDAFDGKGTRDAQETSDACFEDAQVYRSDKFVRDRNIKDGDVSGNWGSRNHYQYGYRRGGFNPGLRSNNSAYANNDEMAYNNQRRLRSNDLKGSYRPLDRRRPPDDNHNSMNRRDFATRDDRCYRSRGGPGFYRQGFVKDSRSEYHNSISNDPTPSSVWAPHDHLVYNRDSSFFRPHRKSPSRSRTRSPVPWHLQRERSMGPKGISRSPTFMSEGRMGRNSMHYDDSKFLENDDGFLSPPRRRFFNDQNSGPARLRERNSPSRLFGQPKRFGSNGTGGRIKADDGGFRPMLNSERFSEQSGGNWRAQNKNNNNYNDGGWRGQNNKNNYRSIYNDDSDSERMMYNNKHEMIRRVRHSETGVAGRRYKSDADDCFKGNYKRNEFSNKNSCSRSIEKSDALGNEDSREGEIGHSKCDGDRTLTISSNLPGIRSSEDDL